MAILPLPENPFQDENGISVECVGLSLQIDIQSDDDSSTIVYDDAAYEDKLTLFSFDSRTSLLG